MPARRYIVYPAFYGPLAFVNATLPTMVMGQAYSATVAPYVSFGANPYGPYTITFQVGQDALSVGPTGLITGTAFIPQVRITNTGAYRITNTQAVRIT